MCFGLLKLRSKLLLKNWTNVVLLSQSIRVIFQVYRLNFHIIIILISFFSQCYSLSNCAVFLTTFYDDVIFWRHDGFFNFLKIMSNLARYSRWNMCHVIKTGKYVNLHCLIFQNLQTELKYHDYSSTSFILKRTQFLNRKCRKLGVSDDVIRKIVTSARKKLCKMVAVMEVSTYVKFHCNSTFLSKVI